MSSLSRSENTLNDTTTDRSLSRIIGSGETAELIRRFDWGKTPLGPVDGWPQILVTTVNLLLASRHPMFLWWGPDLIQFYNDGYRPTIREDKHPSAIGQCGIECWPEIWPIIGPQIDAVMSKGESTWNINQLVPIYRNGKLEEVFWTYSYSPVRDKDGRIHGTLVVCSDTTEQVLSDRRLRTLLAINRNVEQESVASAQPVQHLAQHLVTTLTYSPADIPFAGLFLLQGEESRLIGTTGNTGKLFDSPASWPLQQIASAQTPLLVNDLQQRFGELFCEPWPEPIKAACILPILHSESSNQGVLILGISPRLPFDKTYETFFQLVAARIAGLLEREFQTQESLSAARELGESEERFRNLADRLEEQVRERTRELERSNAEIILQSHQLRTLSNRLMQSQDEERRRIARELHDSVGQLLAAIAMNIALVESESHKLSANAAQAVQENAGMIKQIIAETRTISHLLHPPLLDEAGLDSALSWFVDGFSQRSKVRTRTEIPADFGRLNSDVETAIFRIVQEALTNVHRHSGSAMAAVVITRSENEVVVEVSDEGKGIPAEKQSELNSGRAGVGIRGMQERVRQLGGRLEIHSNVSGTRLIVTLPVN
jgi:signal transduction histidine kinase